jgi:hypothetical protein
MNTLGDFTADLSRWQAQIPEKATLLVQGFTQTLFNEVQSGGKYSPGTPIKSGFARANWDGGIGAIPSNPAATDPGAAAARVDAAILTAQAGDLVYLSNTAPYIRRLEYGWSKQAPAGFIRLALAAGQQIADEVGAFVVEKYGGTAG